MIDVNRCRLHNKRAFSFATDPVATGVPVPYSWWHVRLLEFNVDPVATASGSVFVLALSVAMATVILVTLIGEIRPELFA